MEKYKNARANLRCLPWLALIGLYIAGRSSLVPAATLTDHFELVLALSLTVGAAALCFWQGWARPLLLATLAMQLGLKLLATGLLLRAGIHPLSALLPLLVQIWMLVVLFEPEAVALLAARGELPGADQDAEASLVARAGEQPAVGE